MMRNLKALGLAVVAAMAMAAFAAPGASANFDSEQAHTIVSAEQHAGEDTFTVNAGTVRCSHATYSGTTTTTPTNVVRVKPAYTGCKAFGFVNTNIKTNNCEYEFTRTPSPLLHIVNCATPITVEAFNCWVTVGNQTVTGITYTNQGVGKGRDITVDVNATGITYTQHSKSFPGCTNGTFTNGSYTGAATVRGFNTANEQIGIWST